MSRKLVGYMPGSKCPDDESRYHLSPVWVDAADNVTVSTPAMCLPADAVVEFHMCSSLDGIVAKPLEEAS